MESNIKEFLLEAILNHTDDGIASIDSHGFFTYYNQRMSEIEGLDPDEVIGRYLLDIYPTFNLQNSTMLEALRVGKPIVDVRQCYTNHHGKEITALVTDIPLIQDGTVQGVVEFVKDLDKLESLRQVSKTTKNLRSGHYQFSDFKTINKDLLRMVERLETLAHTDSNVLIYGETGTGKEILAQSIHNASPRKDKPFIAQNCAAIPDALLESIIFGTVKGSFTGAVDRVGLFEQADGGTLLLDELNSMPLHLQPKLLRVLEEGRVTRIGAQVEKKVNVRVISTVNVEPTQLLEEGKLREDLFYRLCRISAYIPPLRERKEDILYLADVFIQQQNQLKNRQITLSKEVADLFMQYRWDGNVREMKNLIESASDLLKQEDDIQLDHLSSYFMAKIERRQRLSGDSQRRITFGERVKSYERRLIRDALKQSRGNISHAAQELGMKRPTLQHKLQSLGIKCEKLGTPMLD